MNLVSKVASAGLLVVTVIVSALSQDLKPGLDGMAPMKWMTVKSTYAPGTVYQSLNSASKTYTQEDLYVRLWFPVVVKEKLAVAIGPHYRAEQFELKARRDEFPDQLSNWALRSWGLDMKAMIKLSSTSWLISTGQVSQSANLSISNGSIPFNYTFSSTFLKKKGANKEMGFGLMVSKSSNLIVLPVFVYNYNFSNRSGIEISLPHKIAYRRNLSATDILYVKSEASTRSYFLPGVSGTQSDFFRRVDIETGIAYNKQLGKYVGIEFFGGYRQNISYHVPENMAMIRTSGWAASFELYLRPPQGLRIR